MTSDDTPSDAHPTSFRRPLPSHRAEEFFVLRSPLLPFDEHLAWLASQACPAGNDASQDHLMALARRPEIAEALFVASPSLSEGLRDLETSTPAKKAARLRASLARYVARMTTRSTPFGLFAGGSLGRVADSTHLELAPRHRNRRHTRLDMDYLFRLAHHLEANPEVRTALRYSPNSSLYFTAGRWRYAEGRLDGQQRSYHLVAVRDDPYLGAALRAAKQGAAQGGIPLLDIAQAIVDFDQRQRRQPEHAVEENANDEAISLDEAMLFVHELVDTQLLVSDLGPKVTGPEPIHDFIERLAPIPRTAPIAAALAEIRDILERLDQTSASSAEASPGEATRELQPESRDQTVEVDRVYRRLAGQLEPLGPEVALPRLFQVDAGTSAPDLRLGPEVLEEAMAAVACLHRLRGDALFDPFAGFREAFGRRYEPGRAVPLVEALDEEVGIGFTPASGLGSRDAPLLQGIHFPPRPAPREVPWSPAQELISQKLFSSARRGETVLRLTDEDLDRLGDRPLKPLPDAMQVICTLLAPSCEAVDRGELRLLFKGASGPSGAALLGRFCHADTALAEQVRAHLRREEAHRPDAVYAEIVHLPEGRIGNILLRPLLRRYEIPFLGHSGCPQEQQIPLDDLWVSVVGDEVVLWSKRLGKRVIPRLTSAHNFSLRGLGIYRFLCSLQSQGLCSGVAWSWGPLDQLTELPRVVYRRTILRPAEWTVSGEEIRPWTMLRGRRRQRALDRWCEERGLPRRVLLADGDNELFVDFDHPLSVEAFLSIVQHRARFRLLEFLQQDSDMVLRGPEGRYAHELILPLIRRAPSSSEAAAPNTDSVAESPSTPQSKVPAIGQTATAQAVTTRTLNEHAAHQVHLPGSRWLYAKLYTGSTTADDILQGPIRQLVQRYGQEIHRWFFIRYNDPDFHLRVRFSVPDDGLRWDLQQRLSALATQLREQGFIWDLQLATYEPEIERYGGREGLNLCEQIFHQDSAAVLAMLPLLRGDLGATHRWLATLASINGLLSGLFADDLSARIACIDAMRQGFADEMGADKRMRRGMAQKLRQHSQLIAAALREPETVPLPKTHPEAESLSPLESSLIVLRQRDQRLHEPMAALRRLGQSGHLAMPLGNLGASLAHMTVNRWIPADARAHEAVLYDFLHRHWLSQQARQRAQRRARRSAGIAV